MKKILILSAALALATPALAQTSGDNPGGRGVTSTGGVTGMTGTNTDGSKAAKTPTTTGSSGMQGGAMGNGNAAATAPSGTGDRMGSGQTKSQ